jgi:hypothetical protein
MRPCIQKTMWLSALIALMTISITTGYAQKQDKEKPAAKAVDGDVKQGGMEQMAGPTSMT